MKVNYSILSYSTLSLALKGGITSYFMLLIYKIAFITGVLYAVTTLVLGQLFNSLDFDVDVDFNISIFSLLPIKPITIVTFITVFGGVGIITTNKGFHPIYSFIISFASAYLVSLLIYRLIIRPLFRAQNTSASSQKDLIGITANVTSTIMENAFGQITYINNGNTYTSPAKNIQGRPIVTGTKVVIVSIKDNVFYVVPKEELYSDFSFDEDFTK